MKTIHNFIPRTATLLAIMCLSVDAADFRIWTSLKGTSIEAQLVSYNDGNVNLTTKEQKAIKLKVTDLSLADRQHLVATADAQEELLFNSELTVPEHKYRKPKDFIKKLEETMSIDYSELEFELYETKHFLFACAKGVNPRAIAETAEACWYGMAFQHNEFRENWGTTKSLLILTDSIDLYKTIGQYAVSQLKDAGRDKQAEDLKESWDPTGSNLLLLPDSIIDKHDVRESARVFRANDSKVYRKKFHSFQTHVITKTLLDVQMGGLATVSGNGLFAISNGHAYYKEIQLTKKTETNLISKDYEEGVGSKSGFKDGTSWAKSLRTLVKKEEVKPDIHQILSIKESNELTPPKLVTIYALSSYFQSNQKRMANYAKLIRLMKSSKKTPKPDEIAEIFGFANAEEFQKDWIDYIKSRDFK